MAAVFLRFGGNFAGETVNPKTVFAGVDTIHLKTIGGDIHTPPESAWGGEAPVQWGIKPDSRTRQNFIQKTQQFSIFLYFYDNILLKSVILDISLGMNLTLGAMEFRIINDPPQGSA